MDNNQLEKNFWKAGQTPLSATNLNLMSNAIVDNAKAINEVIKVLAENGVKIVDKLPETNIKSNVIYGVKKEQVNYNSYLSIFGTRIPFINSVELGEQSIPIILESLNGHVQEEDKETVMMFLVSYGFGPIDISTNDATVRNTFDANLQQFVYYFRANIEFGPKYFSNIEDFTKYILEDGFVDDLNSIVEGAGTDLSQAAQMLKNYGYKYSTIPLSEDEFGAVYEKEVIGETYDYYIYNGEKWTSVNDIKVVKSLPGGNIEVNKIYSLQQDSYESYTSAFGTKFPVFTNENFQTNIDNLRNILESRELNVISNTVDGLVHLGFFPVEMTGVDNKLIKQRFDTDRMQFYYSIFNKYFDTLEEMSDYLLNGGLLNSFTTDEEKQILDHMISDLKSAGFKYSTEELSDEEFGVVYKKNPTIYKYFIYDGQKWIELGKGGVPSISITVSDTESVHEITDEDLETIINNDVVVAKSSLAINSDNNVSLNPIFYKTNTVKSGDNIVEVVLSTISNEGGSETKFPVYVYLIVDVINKTYSIDIYTFASKLSYDQHRLILQNDFIDNIDDVYVSTINGESLLTNTISDVTTSIKLKNKTVSYWASDTTYADYPYRATITESTITSAMVAEVIYGLTEAESGNYAPICQTFNGGIYIYSKINTSIVIPTILLVK